MRHLIPALRIFLLNVVASIYLQLDTLMLGFLKGNEAVGYYTGAIKLTKMLMGITSSLCVVLLPRLSNLVVENEREEFERLLRNNDSGTNEYGACYNGPHFSLSFLW